jgi:hypothetical protein
MERKPPTAEEQEALLREANRAASAGDPVAMVHALYNSYALDGIARYIRLKWESIPLDETRFIIASALDVLFAAVQRGEKVRNIIAYLYKVSDNKAHQYHDAKKREQNLADHLEYTLPKSQPPYELCDPESQLGEVQLDWEEKRARAIGIARELIPQPGQENVRNVMTLIIDAVAAGREDISNQEISDILGLPLPTVRTLRHRGFKRLTRIAQDMNLVVADLDIVSPASEHEEHEEETE